MPLLIAIPKTLRGSRLVLLLTCIVANAGWEMVLADIAPSPLSGGTNLVKKGVEKTNVVMVDEVVKLRVARETCHVDVVFTMTNKGNVAETMPVGFPFFRPDELKDFKAAINDTVVAVTNESGGQVGGGSFDQPAGWKPYWKLWKTTFPPGKPVKIAVSYWTKLSSAPWGWNVELQKMPDLLTALVPDSERAALESKLDVRRVTYILRTGGDWSGPIGRCRIEVSFDGMSSDNLVLHGLNFENDQATVASDKIIWDLKDYEPKRDVEFRVSPHITRTATLQLLERHQKQNPRSPLLTAVLAEYLIAAGRQPEAETKLLQFLNDCQDKVVIWGARGKHGLSLEDSVNVFKLIEQIVSTPELPKNKPPGNQSSTRGTLLSFQPRDPAAFVPAIQRIALSVKDQWKRASDADPYFANMAESMLAWCQKHAD